MKIKKDFTLILLIILLMPFTVRAKILGNLYLGNDIKNGETMRLYTSSSEASGDVSVVYYDGDEIVCSEDINYSPENGYTINCDKGRVWKFTNNENDIYEFQKVELAEENDAYRIENSSGMYNKILKKGDIVLFEGNTYGSISYPAEGYSSTQINNKTIKVGYEVPNWTKEIEGATDYYILVYTAYGSSTGSYFSFIPYKTPKFSIDCENDTLLKGESTTCHLYVDSYYDLDEIDLTLSTKNLSIDKYEEENEKYEVEIEDNKLTFFLIKDEHHDYEVYFWDFYELYLNEEEEKELLISFDVTATDDVEPQEEVLAEQIAYNLAFIEGEETASYEISGPEKEKEQEVINPETAAKGILITSLIAIVTLVTLVVLQKKNISSEI